MKVISRISNNVSNCSSVYAVIIKCAYWGKKSSRFIEIFIYFYIKIKYIVKTIKVFVDLRYLCTRNKYKYKYKVK